MPDKQHENGLLSIRSRHSVDDTVSRLIQMLEAKAVRIFAVIDHSGEAEKIGLRMSNTKLLIFGSPKAGTPLMLAAPSIAIDLPLKILVWEDADARVWITYNDPDFLSNRHDLPAAMSQTLAVAGTLADMAAH
jgi:uncharacterized protein (DUF302 family)